MARLSDGPLVLRRIGFLTFIRRVWQEMNEDSLYTWGAALAYSWLFAIFPFLIFLLTLVPRLPQPVINEAYSRIPIFITIVVATLILLVLVLIPVGNLLTKHLAQWNDQHHYLPQWAFLTLNVARYALAGVLMFTVIAIMYYFGSSVKQKWRVF